MDILLLLARLILAGVFLVAGFAKLADRRGSIQAMRDFGVPTSIAPVAGTALPVAEIVVGIALIPVATAWWGALGSLVLLLAFVAGIGFNLAKGNQPDCHCFGQLHSQPAGWPTLIRNGVLATLAGFVVLAGRDDVGASLGAWIGDLSAAEGMMLAITVVVLALLVIEACALIQLLQQNGRLLLRIEALETAIETGRPVAWAATNGSRPVVGLPVGSKAPAFDLPDIHGLRMSLGTLTSAGKPVLLIFSSPGCGPCNSLLPEIGTWQRQHGKDLMIALVSQGDVEVNRAKSDEHGIRHVLIQAQREISESFQAHATPAAVIVRPDGSIGSPLAIGSDAIRSLVSQTVGMPAAATQSGAVNGQASGSAKSAAATTVPDLPVTTLDGEEVPLTSITGEPTAVLFWNPGCGFCNRMLDDLKAAEANPPAGVPKIVLVSTGDAGRNRAMGVQSTILLDQGFNVGRAFGASGTPSAILIDADGKVSSPVAVGAPAVLSLVGARIPAE